MILKPFFRTYRPGSSWAYISDKRYSMNGQDYINAFKLIQNDLISLFAYVEPSDSNKNCFSHRIQELFVRTCIEIEANFIAILKENNYSTKKNLTIKAFYKLNKTHYLSKFIITLPYWKGVNKFQPFAGWDTQSSIDWYRSYNKIKHSKYEHFN